MDSTAYLTKIINIESMDRKNNTLCEAQFLKNLLCKYSLIQIDFAKRIFYVIDY